MVCSQVKEALTGRGLSLSTAAEKLGVERTFLSRLVNGYRPPKTRDQKVARHDDRYYRIATGLGLDVDSFLEAVEREQMGVDEAHESAGPSSSTKTVLELAKPENRAGLLLLVDRLARSKTDPYQLWQRIKRGKGNPKRHGADGEAVGPFKRARPAPRQSASQGAGMDGQSTIDQPAARSTSLSQDLERIGRALANDHVPLAALLLELAEKNLSDLGSAFDLLELD